MSSPDRLPPCPRSPNCVCSDDVGLDAFIEPLRTGPDPDAAWRILAKLLRAYPGVRIVSLDGDRLRATATSRLLRFVDDLDFRLDRQRMEIAVRSASRLGYWDLGANRARIEKLREQLQSALASPDG